MVVFSLAILRANLRSERAIYPWTLTIVFASLATVANVMDVTTLGLPPVVVAASVKAIAPIALMLAFELLMSMVKAEVRRAATVTGIKQLTTQAAAMRAEIDALSIEAGNLATKRDTLKTELAELRRDKRRETSNAPAETSPATRLEALAILQEQPEISGSDLGRAMGKSESLGRRLKRELLPAVTNGNGHGGAL